MFSLHCFFAGENKTHFQHDTFPTRLEFQDIAEQSHQNHDCKPKTQKTLITYQAMCGQQEKDPQIVYQIAYHLSSMKHE